MKITVPNEWMPLTARMLAELTNLKKQKDFETLEILWVVEKNWQLKVAYRFEPDVDELYEVIMNIIRHYENLMQATSFTKTSNIQGNTGGSRTAF